MSTGPKRSLAEARANCDAFVRLFQGTFFGWTVAGSVRRCRPFVSDIEDVVIPNAGGLFGSTGNQVWERTEQLLRDRAITKAVYSDDKHRWGPLYRGMMFEGFRHELFMASKDNFGSILCIRTGPAEFSERLVTILKQGGRYRQKDGYVRRVIGMGDLDMTEQGIVPTPDEATFLKLCGMPLLAPEQRDAYVNNLTGARR